MDGVNQEVGSGEATGQEGTPLPVIILQGDDKGNDSQTTD